MFKPLKIPVKFKKINLRNRYWQAQDYHFRDYLHTFTRQLKVDVNKSFRRELYRKLIHLSSLWIPLTIYFVREEIAIAIFSAIFIGNGLLEYGNFKKWKWCPRALSVQRFNVRNGGSSPVHRLFRQGYRSSLNDGHAGVGRLFGVVRQGLRHPPDLSA